jgi:hypothetical protein
MKPRQRGKPAKPRDSLRGFALMGSTTGGACRGGPDRRQYCVEGAPMNILRHIVVVLGLLLAFGVEAAGEHGPVELTRERVLSQAAIPVHGYMVAATHPHDRASYTEGLVLADGTMCEGTGLYGRSKVRQWDPKSGRVAAEKCWPDVYEIELTARKN